MKKLFVISVSMALLFLIAACGGNSEGGKQAQEGDTVQVHYRGTLDDGSEFDSSQGRDPLNVTIGSGQVIPGFDQALRGMAVGDKKTVRLAPEEAYGNVREDQVIEVPRADINFEVEEGSTVSSGAGQQGVVIEITDEIVTIDFNHRLAGKALTFELEMVEVQSGS